MAETRSGTGETPVAKPRREPSLLFASALRKEAESGQPQAMLMLGKSAKNIDEALHWLGGAAERGLGQAAGLAGLRCLEVGRREEAVQWFQKGVVLNDAESLYRIGLMAWVGDGIPENRLEALAYLQRAVEQGHPSAEAAKDKLEMEGQGAHPDAETAVDLLRTLPRLHHPETMLALGRALMVGEGVAANPERAMELMTSAAETGWADAHYELSRIRSQGDQRYRDLDAASHHLRLAAEQGHPDAMAEYGARLLKIRPEEAVGYLRRGAEHGIPEALHALGEAAYEGWGTPQNKLEALRCFRAAATAGHREAAARAARMLEKGDGVLANKEEARKWAEQAGGNGGFWGFLGLKG